MIIIILTKHICTFLNIYQPWTYQYRPCTITQWDPYKCGIRRHLDNLMCLSPCFKHIILKMKLLSELGLCTLHNYVVFWLLGNVWNYNLSPRVIFLFHGSRCTTVKCQLYQSINWYYLTTDQVCKLQLIKCTTVRVNVLQRTTVYGQKGGNI